MNREDKTNAIKELLSFSLLFTQEQKKVILAGLNSLSDEEIDGVGKILAYEHHHRDSLDKEMVKNLMSSLEKYI